MLPLNTCCIVESTVTSVDGKKVLTEAEMKNRDGLVYSTASGLFIDLKSEWFKDLGDWDPKLPMDPTARSDST